uniref:CCDC66 domain-containing protein n=1 Tax=Aureoumbra lagunensis TaxID=44058 RepID=A0A7S3NIA5_9STRA|mmetsp:Transcript_7722/g.10751  ORF Transcript_7722/g.10751 Transcript_7722/m.10751 type:complete len:862 (+) Transcript_7722:33-2618(+)|eukprot:CAMPEP_0197311066 /NCGR_PEP_ID=MMETSP0891-20130614/9588_1 /TAXON_ID=44058 ORGANISM="Aureoumbra lagunensis, Strain CCMP1510" /NCGR_SAMPLE_ID=MMETSP0891 /ASSEMBLY_ACC=CAM_ASM_000534 /LENGTH=861 /DNA_ID=CAMNT_0042797005 /DNA_START=29 /DNA_END=2614 /DNA_ORIENTATION=-
MSGPPLPGVDPEFDALVEAEMARRRQQQAVRASPPSKGEDPVFDALVQAEMERQKREASIYAQAALNGGSTFSHAPLEQQKEYPSPITTLHTTTPIKPGGISTPRQLTDTEQRRQRQREYAESLRKQMSEPRRSLRHADECRPPFFTKPENDPILPAANAPQYDPLRPGQVGLGRGMATLPGTNRPPPRREAQEAYAAELRRQMEEKQQREAERRDQEVSEAKDRLRRLAMHDQRLSPELNKNEHFGFSNNSNQSQTHDTPSPLAYQDHHHHHNHQTGIITQSQLSQSPEYRDSARSRFVRDIYGETNVAEMLGADCAHHRIQVCLPGESRRVTRNHDPEADAKRKALALTQKQALEAQIEERKQIKAREKAERQAEEERELREAMRLESEAKERKDAQIAKRQADEQKRLEELYAQQEAAAARRKHHPSSRPLPEQLSPKKVISQQHQQGPPSPPLPNQNGIPKTAIPTHNPVGPIHNTQDDEFELRASRFEAAVTAEVNRLKGKHQTSSSARRHHHHAVESPASIKALTQHYDQEEYDINSLSDLARGRRTSTTMPLHPHSNIKNNHTGIDCIQQPPRLETFEPVADDIDDEEARRLLLRLMPGDKERRRRLAAGLVRDLGRDSFIMSQASPEPPPLSCSIDGEDIAAHWQRHHPIVNQRHSDFEQVEEQEFIPHHESRFYKQELVDEEYDEAYEYDDDRGHTGPLVSPPTDPLRTPDRGSTSRRAEEEQKGLSSTTPPSRGDVTNFQYRASPNSARQNVPHRYAHMNKSSPEKTPPHTARSTRSAHSTHSTHSTKNGTKHGRAQWNKADTWVPPPANLMSNNQREYSSSRNKQDHEASPPLSSSRRPQTWEVEEEERL